ncbi:uncharacterized protein BO97DRAFT_342636 [Aspergillus homomorphus CBS 101889]|uniref:Fungal-type protein kinase domain-containing protein n=1 Tax=Aspergillus homomorphus (strain CBS 101889) TaxID=1450537 RepID=A0A395I0M3_ASPHC|nr:hypothetical protein BO97DRAFT_342636 [Aspergillus homomorphus CBS 101889]RAL13346.1 hypothetical protein BO97DRAFT_342636 [Aspergillus homomorphus CBS 101889]
MQDSDKVTLLEYLQNGPAEAPEVLLDKLSTINTRNSKLLYTHKDIRHIGDFSEFKINEVIALFGSLLRSTHISDWPFSDNPVEGIITETTITARIIEQFKPRLRYGMASGFNELKTNKRYEEYRKEYTTVKYSEGAMARTIDKFTPDLAFFDPTLMPRVRSNRLPGEVKPSYKWSSSMKYEEDKFPQTEFRQVLAQLNYYMIQHHTRYGFVITNKELVAVRRLDREGNLQISESVPWTARGTADEPCMTVLLGLWVLGMLAANDKYWYLN